MSNPTVYIRAAPDFLNLDTELDGRAFLAKIKSMAPDKPFGLIIDISDCYLDYWGCSPVIEGAMGILSDSVENRIHSLAVITSMAFGSKAAYASMFFKGSRFETERSGNLLEVAFNACEEVSIELKIWVVPPGFQFLDLVSLRNPTLILSSK